MPKTVKYIGTTNRWPELAVTGKQSVWMPGQMDERTDSEAAQLLATGLFADQDALNQTPAETAALAALVSKYGTPNGGLYLGAASPKRMRRSSYGRKVGSWTGTLQNSAGTAALVTGDLPAWADNATQALKLTQNATPSFGQQNPIDGGQLVIPKGTSPGFSAGIWVKNPNSRTLNFELRLFNVNAAKSVFWSGAIEPTNTWTFLTFSAAQLGNQGSWTMGTDGVAYVRVTQKDNGPEGAWNAGEYLLFGNVYVDPTSRPRFMLQFDDGYASVRYPISSAKVSGTAYVSASATNTLTTAAAHSLIVGEPLSFTEGTPTGLTVNTTYWVRTAPSSTTFTLATDSTLATQVTGITDGAYTGRYQYAGSQARSAQELVESYGFRGSLFVVGSWIGTNGRYGYVSVGGSFLSGADIQAMWADGWAVGSHSNTHPSNNESAGLRLLGPFGYYLSNPADNLPAQYLTNWSLTGVRRRATSATQASPSVVTFEAAHQFLPNQPIVWTDVAPTGFTVGTTYYVKTTPSSTTATFATDQGVLAAGVNNTTAAWSGTANYRWPGSAPDDSAIYADIMAGVAAVDALGIPTGGTFFALPQGAADTYVRSACIRASLKWVRGISGTGGTNAKTITVGLPSGQGLYNTGGMYSGGWLAQPDALQTDGVNTIAQNKAYVDDLITQGACGCNFHHVYGLSTLVALDQLCSYLRTKVDAGQLDVITCDELAKELGIS